MPIPHFLLSSARATPSPQPRRHQRICQGGAERLVERDQAAELEAVRDGTAAPCWREICSTAPAEVVDRVVSSVWRRLSHRNRQDWRPHCSSTPSLSGRSSTDERAQMQVCAG